MDKSVTRRGKPCWYRLEDIQMDAVNDSLILESFIYYLLKKFCGHESWYLQLVELYHDVNFSSSLEFNSGGFLICGVIDIPAYSNGSDA